MKEKWKMYALLIIPWLSVKKLGKLSFKRYFPTILFSNMVIAFISELSRELKWWKVKNPIFPKLATDVSFVFRPFTILNLWIFKLTYKRFWLYLLTNIFADYLFAYPLTTIAEKLRVYKMVRMSRKQLFFLSVAVAIINYLYQYKIIEPQQKSFLK
ncbi:hypothetical protein E2K98_05675 [Bacillus salipaludis]|uniref:Uncharacterized protein n=1 Tax=Bacillus salipaludis TaxID=2547811 RepID=A0A4R5VX18_9BACI|nr:hypothetical protein [Bacillus salipaludis]MDQ6597644.1 hypothetical protein [Bacillus salipaludis]TDK62952.1 hypothetical protein E2K98_05675 [Bacillus salipaludis]